MAAQLTITVTDEGQLTIGGQLDTIPLAVQQKLLLLGMLTAAMNAVTVSPQQGTGPPSSTLLVANGALPRFRQPG
jgi:hypothetical protein